MSSDLTVLFTLTGTATAAVDYSLGVTASDHGNYALTIPAGQTSADLTLTALPDSRTEGTEYATVTLKPATAYKLGNPSTLSINITDDDSTKLPANGYTLSDLGLTTYSSAYALNDNATPSVAGNYVSGTGYDHGFRKTGSVLTDLGVIQKFYPQAAQNYSFAFGVNNFDVIVGSGYSYQPNSSPYALAYYFRWSGGVMSELGVPAAVSYYDYLSGPMSVNDAGWIVGFARNSSGTFKASKWDSSGNWSELGALGSSLGAISYTWAVGQFANGNRVAGQSQFTLDNTSATTPAFHAFRTQPNGTSPQTVASTDDLGNYLASETSSSGAYAINALGEVAGYSAYSATENRAAYKDGNSGKHLGWSILGALSGGTGAGNTAQALGLNNVGVIVGWSRTTTNGSPHAVVWENYQTPAATDLNGKLTATQQAEWVLVQALAINQGGTIVGFGLRNGVGRAFMLTPNP